MADDDKKDPPAKDDDKKDPPALTTDKADPPPSGDDDDKLQKMVEAAVEKALADKQPEHKSGVVRRSDLEEQAKKMVEEATARLRAEEEKENRIKGIEEKVNKITEDPPENMPKLRKLLWGEKK